MVVAPTEVVGSANPANTELAPLAHAALSLQVAFANRAVPLPYDHEPKLIRAGNQLEQRHYREADKRRSATKRKCSSTIAQGSQPSVLPSLAHGQALAQALGSPIDGLSIQQQQRACEAVFETHTSSMLLGLASPPNGDDELPCHRCGHTIKLGQEDSMACIHCKGEPIHRNCLPHGEHKHECQWCVPTGQQSVESEEAPSSPMSLGTLLAIL
jgi:hypothetical protein